MTPRKAATAGLDPDDAAAPDANVFGLDFAEDEAGVVLLPVPWDATTSYRPGTAAGWRAIQRASHQVELLDLEARADGLARPWEYGIHLARPAADLEGWNVKARALARPIIEGGPEAAVAAGRAADLAEVNRLSAAVNRLVEAETERRLARGKLVGVIGGEHSVSFGAIRAHARRDPGLGLLQVDAHADLRAAYEGFEHSHASIIHNVLGAIPEVAAVTQVGVRDVGESELARIESDDRVTTFFDPELRRRQFCGDTWSSLCDEMVATLPERVYVTFDVDGLDPALCPSTGTPVPGGLGFQEASHLLMAVHRSGRKVVGFDLTEVAPAPPGSGDPDWDGNVGARLLYRLIAVALLSNGART